MRDWIIFGVALALGFYVLPFLLGVFGVNAPAAPAGGEVA